MQYHTHRSLHSSGQPAHLHSAPDPIKSSSLSTSRNDSFTFISKEITTLTFFLQLWQRLDKWLELFQQVIDIDMEIIFKLDEVHRRLCFNLVNDHSHPPGTIIFGVFHIFAYQAIHRLQVDV